MRIRVEGMIARNPRIEDLPARAPGLLPRGAKGVRGASGGSVVRSATRIVPPSCFCGFVPTVGFGDGGITTRGIVGACPGTLTTVHCISEPLIMSYHDSCVAVFMYHL